MSSNEIETNDVNGFQLAQQGPSSSRCSRQGNIGRHHVNPVGVSRKRGPLRKRGVSKLFHQFPSEKHVFITIGFLLSGKYSWLL